MMLSTSVVFAADAEGFTLPAKQQEKITLLYKMGIIESDEITSDTITRGEFALILANLSGNGNISPVEKFEDVPTTHKYAGAIALVSAIGCMNGISDTEFGVANEISKTNATVALLRLLGFEKAAQQKGGYPAGYLGVAAGMGLTKNTNTGNSRADILLTCYNALVAPSINANGRYDSDNRLLLNVHGISKVEGTMTGNRFTCIGRENSGLEYNEIKIDDKIYITEDATLSNYIGEYVTGYYYFDKTTDERQIVTLTVKEDESNKIVIKDKKIISAADNKVVYEDEDEKTETVRLRAGFDYIVNNCTVDERTTADLKVADGVLTLIDYDGDDVYDLAKVTKIETMVYMGADNLEDLIYCKEGTIFTDPFDKSYYSEIILIDSDGTEKNISIDEIPLNAVLTVYRSADDKYLLIYAYSSNVYGVIEEITDDTIIIDGAQYEYPVKTPVADLTIGAEVAFSQDMFGRLVYMIDEKIETGPFYGYFFAYQDAKGLGNAQVKIITQKGTQIYDCAEKVSIDDAVEYSGTMLKSSTTLFDGAAAKRQLIRYKLNAANQLKAVYTVGGASADYSITKQPGIEKTTGIQYYHWHDIWAKQYIQPDDCFFLVIPDYVDGTTGIAEADNEELYSSTYNWGADINSVYYTDSRYLIGAELYDVDPETMEIGAILLYVNKPLDAQAETNTDTATGIFEKVTMGPEGPRVYIHNPNTGTTETYDTKTEYYPTVSSITSTYGFGDVIRYVTAGDGKITTLYKILDVGATALTTGVPKISVADDGSISDQNGYYYSYFGRVHKKLENHIAIIPNLLGTSATTGAPTNPTFEYAADKIIILPATPQVCRVIDMKSKKIIPGSADAVAQYFEDSRNGGCYVYASVYKFANLTQLFIYKF